MTEDPTKDLTTDEILRLILGRLDKLEAQGEKNTTRPLLDQIIREMVETREILTERMDRMEGRLEHIEAQLEELTLDVMNVRGAQRRLEGRVSDLERRPN